MLPFWKIWGNQKTLEINDPEKGIQGKVEEKEFSGKIGTMQFKGSFSSFELSGNSQNPGQNMLDSMSNIFGFLKSNSSHHQLEKPE